MINEAKSKKLSRFLNWIYSNRYWIMLALFNCLLLSSLLVFGGENYSIDSYRVIARGGIETEWKWHFGQLVFLNGIISLFFGAIGHNPIENATFDIISFVIILSVCSAFFANRIAKKFNLKDASKIIITNLCFIISFANIWYCNTISFPECVFLCAINIIPFTYIIIKFLNIKNVKDYVVCGIMLVLLFLCWKLNVTLFVIYIIGIISAQLIIRGEKSFKGIFLSLLKPAIMVLCSTVVYFLIATTINKLCDVIINSRVSVSIDTFIRQSRFYFGHAHSFLKGRGFFSSELLTICWLVIGILWLISVIKYSKKHRNITLGLFLAVAVVASYFFAHAPLLLADSHSFRGLYPLFSLFFVFSIAIIIAENSKIIRAVALCVMCVLVVSNIWVSVDKEIDQKIANSFDEQYAESVLYAINEYEKDTGNTILKIAQCYDLQEDYGGVVAGDDNCFPTILQFISGKEYDMINMPDKVSEQFANKNWSVWDPDEQMIFDGDTLYLCVY